jgi:opacity protein-like surface antigen
MNNFTKYTILLAATSLCAINAANAVEKGKFYASGSYGVGFADKFDYKDEDGVLAVKKPSNANVFGLAVGYGVTDNIRAELSYNGFYGMKYKYTQTDEYEEQEIVQYNYNQKVSANALFISAYYDINKFDKIKPYVAAGVGVANVKSGNINILAKQEDKEDINDVYAEGINKKQFAWQLGTGVNYVVNDKIDLNLVNYRYSNLGKAVTKADGEDPELKTKLAVHSISTGITFKF